MTETENALDDGIRLVDRRSQPSAHTTLMQAVESGHVHHAGTIVLNTERHIYHLPGLHGSASLAAGILRMEYEGRILDSQDIQRKILLIEQPVQPINEQDPYKDDPALKEKAPNAPFYLKPSIESLLEQGEPVPEIAQLLAGEIGILRPVLSSSSVKLPQELVIAATASKISVESILVQNHIDVFSNASRSKEADELVRIASGGSALKPQQGAERIREVLGLHI